MLQSIKLKCKLSIFAKTREQGGKASGKVPGLRRTRMYFRASLLLLFAWREATTEKRLRSQATKPFGLASPFSCRSHVTSHDIPKMKSLLARFHYTSCIENSHLMIIFSAIMHFGGDLI